MPVMGTGVPNMMSCSSVAIMDPPQPSTSAARACLGNKVAVVLVNAHVRAVHQVHDLAVYAARHQVVLAPQLLPFERRALGEHQVS